MQARSIDKHPSSANCKTGARFEQKNKQTKNLPARDAYLVQYSAAASITLRDMLPDVKTPKSSSLHPSGSMVALASHSTDLILVTTRDLDAHMIVFYDCII